MFKVNNKDTIVFIVNFEHISHLVLVLLLLTSIIEQAIADQDCSFVQNPFCLLLKIYQTSLYFDKLSFFLISCFLSYNCFNIMKCSYFAFSFLTITHVFVFQHKEPLTVCSVIYVSDFLICTVELVVLAAKTLDQLYHSKL